MERSWEDAEAQMLQVRQLLDRAHEVARERVAEAAARAVEIESVAPKPAIDGARIQQLRRTRDALSARSAAIDSELRRFVRSLQREAEGERMSADPPRGGTGSTGSGTSSKLKRVVEIAEEAVEGILAEAESEAKRLVAEAEAKAERLAREKAAAMTRTADEMLEHATVLNERAQSLLDALGAAIAEYESREPDERPKPSASDEPAPGPAASPRQREGDAPAAEPRREAPREQEREPLRTLRRRLNELGRSPRTHSREAPETEEAPNDEEPTAERTPSPQAPQRRTGTAARNTASEGAVLLATQMAVAGGSREQIEARLRNDFGIQDPGPILDGLVS